MKKATSKPLSRKQQAELKALAALPDNKIDTDAIPEARIWNGARRGLFYRPVKKQITLRLDADIVDWFRTHASKLEGYQTQINKALRGYVERQETK